MKCVFICLLFLAVSVYAHPPTTFTMILAEGTDPNTAINRPYNLSFIIYDLLNDQAVVPISQLVPYHGRYMHVMLACGNMEEIYHLHPEDYSTYEEMLQQDSFFVTVSFPTKGKWYISTSFMTNISGILREGSAQYEFSVVDFNVEFNPTYDFYTNNSFKTYDIPASQIFDQEVNTQTNIQTVGGYSVQVEFATNMQKIEPYTCQPFYISVTGPDGKPATNFIPYLDAPLHIIFVASMDTVYHGHGMDLPAIAPTLEDAKRYAMMVGMSGHGGMTVEEDAVMMNAMMTGINNMGQLNCTADLGAVMQKYHMDPYMSMLPTSNYTFGPKFLSIFDFPNYGYWRMFVYLRVQEGNETKLIVPHFSLNSNNQTFVPTTTNVVVHVSTTDDSKSSAAYFTMTWCFVAWFAICSLALL